MNSKLKRSIIIGLLSFLPLFAFAAAFIQIPSDAEIQKNGFCALATLINNIITWFLSLSAVVAAITFSIAGGKMLLNPENSGEREAAKEMFKKTVIGMIIILIAWLVVHSIIAALVGTGTGALRFLDTKC